MLLKNDIHSCGNIIRNGLNHTIFNHYQMPAHRKTSLVQIIELIGYLEKHKDIKLGTAVPKEKHKDAEHWQKLSKILNNLPGEPKDTTKWRNFWNELKWRCRKRAADGSVVLKSFEKRVLNLVGVATDFPVYMLPKQNVKTEPRGSSLEDNHDDVSYADNSRLSENQEQKQDQDRNCMTPDPMPTPDIAVDNYNSLADLEEQKQKQEPEELEVEDELEHSTYEDVPEWVRKVEHSRLGLEERTTRAIEQMSAGISSMADAMHSIVGSLHNIEASIRALNNQNSS